MRVFSSVLGRTIAAPDVREITNFVVGLVYAVYLSISRCITRV